MSTARKQDLLTTHINVGYRRRNSGTNKTSKEI